MKNFLLLAFRSLLKNKLFISINVLGMGIAIGCCLVGYLALECDRDFDAAHVNRDHIYRVSPIRVFDGTHTRFANAPLPLHDIVEKTFEDVDFSTRYYHSYSNFKRENDLFASHLSYVDPDFFRMFSFEFISGDPKELNDKTSLYISEKMATRLFRDPKEAQGKTITQVLGNELKEVKIAGVFREPPMNTSFFKYDGLSFMNMEAAKDEHALLKDNRWERESMLFVQINDDARRQTVHQQLQQYIKNNNEVREDFQIAELTLDPFTTLGHRDRDENTTAATRAAPPQSAVMGSMIMSVFILLIACFNLTNTAIAVSSRRLKEIGIRKVMGSQRFQLIIQFIGETTLICLLALLVGIVSGDWLIQGWNYITDNNIRLEPHYTPSFMLFALGILLFTGIMAGSYPAFYISKFNPVKILKGKVQLGGTNYFTRFLLGFQFALSLISIVTAIGFYQNAKYQQAYDLGFDARGSIIAWVNGKGEYDTYRNALQQHPEIISMAGASSGIFSTKQHEPVKYESQKAEVDIIGVGDNYLKTMDLKLISGRDFIVDSETDQKESIIITQKMAELFGWEQPLGKEITWKDSVKLFVVGVVKDVYTEGLWRELDPMMIRYVRPEQYAQIVVNTKEENVASVSEFMNEQWNIVFPNRLYNGYMVSNSLRQVKTLGLSIVAGNSFMGCVALLLSVTGLFGLVSLNIAKRMKEIGVRKVLGASVGNIARVINMEFMIIILVAAAFGSWAGYAWSGVIMGSIWKYYQSANALTFIVAVSMLLIASVGAIGYKIFSVATMNPVKTLRDE